MTAAETIPEQCFADGYAMGFADGTIGVRRDFDALKGWVAKRREEAKHEEGNVCAGCAALPARRTSWLGKEPLCITHGRGHGHK